jgi:hypothetical protein
MQIIVHKVNSNHVLIGWMDGKGVGEPEVRTPSRGKFWIV